MTRATEEPGISQDRLTGDFKRRLFHFDLQQPLDVRTLQKLRALAD